MWLDFIILSDTRPHSWDVLDDDKGDSRFRFICALSKNWKPKKCRKHSLLLRDSFRGAHSRHRFIYSVFVARNWSYWGLDNTSLSWYIPSSLYLCHQVIWQLTPVGHCPSSFCLWFSWRERLLVSMILTRGQLTLERVEPGPPVVSSQGSVTVSSSHFPPTQWGPLKPLNMTTLSLYFDTFIQRYSALRNAADSTVWLKETYFPINSWLQHNYKTD